jgi:hypothetical protein
VWLPAWLALSTRLLLQIEALEAELRLHEDHDILTRLEARTVAA